MDRTTLGRRAFTLEAALAILGGATITLSSCREAREVADPDPAPPPTPASTPTPAPLTDKTGVFLANHGHEAVVTAAHLTAGGALRLNIRGTANHLHIVDLSTEEIAAIARNEPVAKESSEEKGHTHHILFN